MEVTPKGKLKVVNQRWYSDLPKWYRGKGTSICIAARPFGSQHLYLRDAIRTIGQSNEHPSSTQALPEGWSNTQSQVTLVSRLFTAGIVTRSRVPCKRVRICSNAILSVSGALYMNLYTNGWSQKITFGYKSWPLLIVS